MIERVVIRGLPSYGERILDLRFNEDINIITGINGQGKTTLLKLIWYVYSGNLVKVTTEIEFEYILMITNTHKFEIKKCSKEKMRILQQDWENHSGYDLSIYDRETNSYIINTTDIDAEVLSITYCSEKVAKFNQRSFYFPTFRRIEGFSSYKTQSKYPKDLNHFDEEEQLLTNVMNRISRSMSIGDHKYITSVSTKDINELITNKYAEISEDINNNYKFLSDHIEAVINKENHKDQKDEKLLSKQLNTIKDLLNSNKTYRHSSYRPIQVINDVVTEVFKRKGVKINNTISLGEQKQIIDSNYLSAGEKQMLSFIAYNALYSKTPIIIDEPEISLHVDWQRKLLRILKSQNTNNQLIVATHSPFIYSKYGDKEIIKNFEGETNNINTDKVNYTKINYIDYKDFLEQMKRKEFEE